MKYFLTATALLLLCFSTLSAANQWNPSLQLTPNGTLPVVQLDSNGNSVALWVTTNTQGNGVLMSSILPYEGTTWTTLLVRDLTSLPGSIVNPQLALDANGDAVAVWQENTADGNNLGYSSLPFGASAWSSLFFISGFINESPTNPSMGVDASGNAVVVWQGYDAANDQNSIRSETIPFGSTTDPGTTINLSTIQPQGFTPIVTVNSSGNAIAVWEGANADATAFNIEVANCTELGEWTNTLDLFEPDGANYLTPMATINGTGNGAVVWYSTDGVSSTIQGADYLSGIWALTSTISAVSNDETLQIGIDSSNDVLITYIDNSLLTSATLLGGTPSWSNTQNVSTAITLGPEGLVVLPSGLSTVLYTTSTSTVQASMLSNPNSTTPWSTPVILDTAGAIGEQLTVAGNNAGNFIAVWPDLDGSLRSSFFGPPAVPSPILVSAVRLVNQFLLQAEIGDYFTFTPLNPKTGVVAYAIFTDSALTKKVAYINAANTFPLEIALHNLRNTPQTYYIVSINDEGLASAPIVVTL